MGKTLINGIFLVFFLAISNVAISQDLSFTAVTTNTDCDNPNHCVDIQVTGFTDIATFQFAFFYDDALLDHVSSTSSLPNANIGNPTNGQIRLQWFDSELTLADNSSVFSICFQPTGIAGSTTTSLGQDLATGFPASAATGGFARIFILDTDFFLNDATFIIEDNQDPTISCPSDIMITGNAPMVVSNLAPTMFGDNCLVDMIGYNLSNATSGSGMDDASGAIFNEGTTTVTYNIQDGAGNTGTCNFDVTLDDPTPTDTTFTFAPEISLDCVTGNVEFCLTVENGDSLNSIGVYWNWDETQIDYISRDIIVSGSSIFSDAFVSSGVAGFIWNDGGATGGISIPNGDSLFCVQYAILSAIDTPIITITDLPIANIEVFAYRNGNEVEIPYLIKPETYNVNDNTPPTFTNCPTDTTIILAAGTCAVNYTWTSPNGMDDCIANLGVDSTHASGDLFNIGATTVTYTMTDLGGNTATCDFIVTVVDNEVPTATCPNDTTVVGPGPIAVSDINVMASDPCGPVTVTWELTDATTGTGTGDVSGTNFETGMTTVTYTVADGAGNTSMCSFVVTVDPPPVPMITCPNDTIVGNSGSDCSAMVLGLEPTIVTDPADVDSVHYVMTGATSGSGLTNVSGFPFNVGVTNVTYYLTDILGQIDSCEFTVTVNDTVAPTASCPILDAFTAPMGQCGIVVNNNLYPMADDNCAVDNISYVISGATGGMGSNDPTGSFFNVGISTINYTIADAAGNMTTCSVTVWVNDGEIPTITCRTDTTVNLPFGTTSGPITGLDPITVGDNCADPEVTFAVTGTTMLSDTGSVSGQIFNLGINNVTYYVSDTSGNTDSCSFLVTVNAGPIGDLIDCPNDTLVYTQNPFCGAVVNDLSPILLVDTSLIDSITYLVDGATMLSDSGDVSGEFFNSNISTVTYYATDILGNLDSCQFTVTVNDTIDPIWLNCPPDTITVYVDNTSCKQVATWNDPIPVDNCTIQLLTPPTQMQGDSFDLGFTTLVYSAMDESMNVGTCEFVISVRDTFPPVVNCPSDIVVTTMTGCGMDVSWVIDPATDNCMVTDFSSTQNPGDNFPVGVTTVVYTAMDLSGNSAQCSFNITVIDGAAPITDCPAELMIRVDGTIVSDPTGLITGSVPGVDCNSILINFDAPDAVDECDGVVSAVQYAGIQSGASFPIGMSLVSFSATDMNGNIDTCEFNITVLPLGEVTLENSGINPYCSGEEVTILVATPISGATYTWIGPDGFTGTGTSITISNSDVDNAGTYEVTCTAGGGCTSTGTINIDILPLPDFTAGSNSPICSNGGTDLELTATLNTGSVTVTNWEWTGPNGFTSSDQNPVISNAGSGETGTYSVTATGSNGCTQISTVEVVIDDVVTPTISSNCDGAICIGESCLLLGTEFSTTPDAYVWTAEPSATIGFEADTDKSSVLVTPTAAGVYIINYQVILAGGCETEVVSFVLTVEGAPDAMGDVFTTTGDVAISGLSLISNDVFNADIGILIDAGKQPDHGILVINDDGTFTYVPEEGFLGQDSFSYEICSNCGVDLCDAALVLVNVEYGEDECEIPTVITPNGDTKNEELIIGCLVTGDYPNNSIAIYNQWGDEVFKAAPYNNNWKGTYKDEPLPDGTYFYIFNDGNGGEISKGALTIFR